MTTRPSPQWLDFQPADFDRFFDSHGPSDLYATVRGSIEEHAMLVGAFLAVGASIASFDVPMPPDAVTTVELEAHGVPRGSLVLDVKCAPAGGPMPSARGSNASAHRRVLKGLLVLFGACATDAQRREGATSVMVTWIALPENGTPLRHLLFAATHYSDAVVRLARRLPAPDDFDRVLVAASTAAETALDGVLFRALSGFANKETTGAFLHDGATYAHRLEVLLPIVAHLAGAPALPGTIRRALIRLHELRNGVAQGVAPQSLVTRAVAAEMLTAALFGCHYARVVGDCVAASRANGRLPASSSMKTASSQRLLAAAPDSAR